jgi:hypothetical protein
LEKKKHAMSQAGKTRKDRSRGKSTASKTIAMIDEALATFRKELPSYFENHRLDWVAYHGRKRLGFGKSKDDLFRDCLAQGFDRRSILVRKIDDDSLSESSSADASPNLF